MARAVVLPRVEEVTLDNKMNAGQQAVMHENGDLFGIQWNSYTIQNSNGH